MDINSKTLTIFKSFIDDLIKVFPEHKNILIENYSDIISLDTIDIYENDLELLKGVNFKNIWN